MHESAKLEIIERELQALAAGARGQHSLALKGALRLVSLALAMVRRSAPHHRSLF